MNRYLTSFSMLALVAGLSLGNLIVAGADEGTIPLHVGRMMAMTARPVAISSA